MANGIYRTEGIVLGRTDTGETDKFLSIFTKDFGMLQLLARGVRTPKSKLNIFLNLFSYIRVGFVSGKDIWHLIDAEDLKHFDPVMEAPWKVQTLGRLANFMSRFHKGEVRDEVMFELLLSFLKFLSGAPREWSQDLELAFRAKALLVLGYLNEDDLVLDLTGENREKGEAMLHDTQFSESFFPFDDFFRSYLIRHINSGSVLSHL